MYYHVLSLYYYVLPCITNHELHRPKSQFVKYQCLFSMYYHYANSAVLSRNSQWSMFVYYQCIIMYLQNSHQLLTHLHYVSGLPRQRTLGNSSELRKFHAIRPHSLRITRNSHHLLTYYILCFRCLTSGRELSRIPANQAKFAQFAQLSHELREFRAFCCKLIHN